MNSAPVDEFKALCQRLAHLSQLQTTLSHVMPVPTLPSPEKFAEAIRSHAEKIGTLEAAKICGVTPRTIQLWIRGEGNPNPSTQVGALELLRRAKGNR